MANSNIDDMELIHHCCQHESVEQLFFLNLLTIYHLFIIIIELYNIWPVISKVFKNFS